MKKYIIKRLLQIVPMVIGVTVLVFALMCIAPGDPVQRRLLAQGMPVEDSVIEKERHKLGLDRSFAVQYGIWFKNAVHGDLGISYKDGKPVTEKLNNAFTCTLKLAGTTIAISVLIAIPLGIFIAVKKDKIPDYVIRFISFVGNSIPNFLICILLIYFLCIKYKRFSIISENNAEGLFLPTISLAIPLICKMVRQVRAEMLEQLKKDYISGARSRGVKEKYVLFFNAFRNSLSGIITVIGLSIGTLLGGSVVIETIFRWPGAGKLVMDAVGDRDYPIIQGFVLLTAVIYILINLFIDICYRLIDPRMES